jgi:hypothetical protein
MVIFTDGNRIFHKGQIIFDTEWPKEVPLIDVLSSAEQYLVWLYDIQRLESECESTIGYSYDEFLRIFHAERRDIMLSIINKLKKEP